MTSTSTDRRRLTVCFLAAAVLLAGAAPASAQKKDPKWTIEGFGGYAFSPGAPDGDDTAQFPAGNTFTTEGGFTSRAVPSWYFGDGAALFNAVASQFGSRYNIQVPAIVPLDAILGAAGRKESSGTAFGGRITRRLTSRVALELGFQRSQADAGLTASAKAAIEASRASFESAFTGLLGTIPQAGLQVTSTVTIPGDEPVARTVIHGALNVSLIRSGPFALHVTAGVGRETASADSLDVPLHGNYQFRFFDQNPINETDNVTIHYADRESTTIGVFGGGFTFDLAARHGLRVDARVHTGRSGQTTVIEASPNVVRSGAPIALPSITTPSIQFSNTTALPTSLSGAGGKVTTFTADSLQVRPFVTLSYFVRF